MNKQHNFCSYLLVLFIVCGSLLARAQQELNPVTFTVSMEHPNTHYFHIEMEYDKAGTDECLIKMPVWTPGYYWMLNFSRNVMNFSASDRNGKTLGFTKTDLNTWKIEGEKKGKVKISYDVFANKISVAEPFLDDGRAFISPTGIFMFPDKKLNNPVLVKIRPDKGWKNINTGLKKINGEENTWLAKDFDELYDCPILAGNMETRSFDLEGITYTIVIENPAGADCEKYAADFKKIARSATHLIGDVPYDHYEFLIMDKGLGGLEHRNSMVVFSTPDSDMSDTAEYTRWLAFIAHEFFHLYNVKTIRPIALGPFDYCNENLTHMLWVAEGLTVYYEYIVLNKAGLMPRQDVLDAYSNAIATFENAPGRKYMTARQSSFETWLNFFSRDNHTANTTISYYDIGCALGLLLDLKIRHETENRKSLNDVMRMIYYDFHKKQKRGYTDDEFRKVCEDIAGCRLDEIFRYAATTVPIDYQKYLSYTGISIDLSSQKKESFGIDLRMENNSWTITDIDRNSPAWKNGLSIGDKIILVNGNYPDKNTIEELLHPSASAKRKLKIERRTGDKEFVISTFEKKICDYKMQINKELTQSQKDILESWLTDL